MWVCMALCSSNQNRLRECLVIVIENEYLFDYRQIHSIPFLLKKCMLYLHVYVSYIYVIMLHDGTMSFSFILSYNCLIYI